MSAVEEAKNDAKEPENKSETNKLTTLPAKKKSGSKTKKPPVKGKNNYHMFMLVKLWFTEQYTLESKFCVPVH